MNRQLVAFLSLFSIVLLLSVYYVLIPFASSSSNKTEPVAQVVSDPTSAYFDTLKADRDEGYYFLISELQGEISCSSYTNTEKEVALTSIYNIEKTMKEQNRYMKGIFSFVGFRTCWIPYENVERTAGVSKWSIRRLCRMLFSQIQTGLLRSQGCS